MPKTRLLRSVLQAFLQFDAAFLVGVIAGAPWKAALNKNPLEDPPEMQAGRNQTRFHWKTRPDLPGRSFSGDNAGKARRPGWVESRCINMVIIAMRVNIALRRPAFPVCKSILLSAC